MSIIPSSQWVLDEVVTTEKINQPYYIQSGLSLPASGKEGRDIFYCNNSGQFYLYYNSRWNVIDVSGQLAIHNNTYHTNDYYYQESDLTNVLNDNYPASSQVNRSLINSISSNLDGRIDVLEGYDQFEHEYYITSSNAIDRFAASSALSSHKLDSSIHFTKTSIDDDYAPSSLTLSRYNEYVGHSGQSNRHIDHSAVTLTAGAGMTGGGDITDNRTFTVGAGTGITVNADDVEVSGYTIISSNAKAGSNFAGSGTQYTIAYNWVSASSQRYEDLLASGTKYSTAYTHSQDNTQAHSDYLVNNADDTTTGTLTAHAFSGTAISGGSLKVGNTRITNILDEDAMGSDSDTALATQQSIKAYVDANIGGASNITWNSLTAGTGIDDIAGVSVSSASAETITVLGYDTISSNAVSGQLAKSWLDASGNKYNNAYQSAQIALYSETYTGTVDTSGTPLNNDFAKFIDTNTIVGRNYTETKTDLSLNNVTNHAQLARDGSLSLTNHWAFGNYSISGGGHGLQLHPSGLILPKFQISSGHWVAASNPPIGLMFISGS